MNTIRLTRTLGLVLAGLLSAASPVLAQTLFVDNFDGLSTGLVANDSAPYSYFGAVTDVEVVDNASVSSPNGVAISFDFTGENSGSFGVGFTRYVNYNPITDSTAPLDLTDAVLSVDIKSSVDLSGSQPLVAFRIGDSAGTTLVRASAAQFFTPGTGFTTYSIVASSLNTYDAGGSIDLTDIRQLSVIIFNLGENLAGTFMIDNLAVTAIPEPSCFAWLAGSATLAGMMVLRRSRRR